MQINLRGCSGSQNSQFDIDVGPVVLSSLINSGVDGLNEIIGRDNSVRYYQYLRTQRLTYLRQQQTLSKMEAQEYQRY